MAGELHCICCGREMDNIMGDRGHQPVGGLSFHSYGHYGTTFFDPMDGSYIQIAVCDSCLEKADASNLIRRDKPKGEREVPSIEEAQRFVIETFVDKIDGLESDLDAAVEVAWNRGAHDWVRLNYPKHYERFTGGKG